MKTTIIDADIVKYEGKGAIFLRQFLIFFHKKCRKRENHRSSHLKIFWEQGVLEIKKKKRKLASLGKILGNFLEKYLTEFFCSQVTG